MITLTQHDMHQKGEIFEQKFAQALQDGFFYVEAPESCKDKITKVRDFAFGVRDNEKLKVAKLDDPRLGYQVRKGTQAVAFSAKSYQWEQVFPKEVCEIASLMNDIALDVLKMSLKFLSVPEREWSKITGELTDGKGTNVFTLNQYDPAEKQIGLIPHKDMGWITVLFIDKVGLETSVDGKHWKDVPPKKGCFVINLGRAFELLINSQKTLRASLHRVRQVAEERISFGIFINHNKGTDIHQMKGEELVRLSSYEDYVKMCLAEFEVLQKKLGSQERI